LEGAGQLFSSQKSPDSRWMLERIEAGPDGKVRILSDTAEAVVSTRNTPVARKYLLNTRELREGETYRINDLPRYLDPKTPYVSVIPPSAPEFGNAGSAGNRGSAGIENRTGLENSPGGGSPSSAEKYSLKFIELSSGRTYQGPDVNAERPVVPVPDADFSTIVLQRRGVIAITSLPALAPGKVSTVELEQSALQFNIQAGRSAYPVHITIKRGRRYASLVSGLTDSSGRLKLYFDRSLLERNSESFVLLHGSPITQQRLVLGELQPGDVRLE
jgi:hypothetical protein